MSHSPAAKTSLDPWFVTGLFDAEGSFVVIIVRDPTYSTG